MSTKYIFITGGVCSSLGKGLTAASIGMLLERKGFKISMLKLDPYLNVDPGTMSPFQHGEVYVTDDGAETDLDLGHYFRFTDSSLTKLSNTTSGQVYDAVIKRERRGDYLGKTIQVIPHITDEIKSRIQACATQDPKSDIVIVEIGGTVGDIESLPFLEAIRQFHNEHVEECINIFLTYVPYIRAAGEVKTKPTQHSVGALRSIGIFPDIILCRCEDPLPESERDKISLFCNVKRDAVIDEPDVKHSIYEVPLYLHEHKLDSMVCKLLSLPDRPVDLKSWNKLVDAIKSPKGTITLGIVGKYVQHKDAYKSLLEALRHGAVASGVAIEFKCFEADKILDDGKLDPVVEGCDGYLVPGGYGERGWKGKLRIAQYARENKIPFFGICLGMQVMSVEFARNVCKLNDANSTEIDPCTPHPIVSLLAEQKHVKNLGGTMRLGSYPCSLKAGSRAQLAYQSDVIHERHRHRYEFNNHYLDDLQKNGFIISGTMENGELCEIVEIQDHPWMVGVQFHPEFKSKLEKPHPLFRDFVKAMIKHKEKK